MTLEALEERLTPSTFTVTDNSDNPADTGSLRFAIDNLATGTADTTNTINFQLPLSGGNSITLTSANGPLDLNEGVTISGSGVTISGGNAIGLLTVDSGVSASIAGMTLTDGLGGNGGAITNDGNLSVQNCSFVSNNSLGNGGAIENNADLAIVGDVFTNNTAPGNGGAIANEVPSSATSAIVTLTVSGSTFSGNTANQSGGAIDNDASLAQNGGNAVTNIETSTFSTNTAEGGGGIYNNFGTLTVDGSTLTLNSALDGGGVYNTNGTATVTNSTFSDNNANFSSGDEGGAIFNANLFTAIGCSFVDNSAAIGGGAIENGGIQCTVVNCTFSGNSAGFNGGAIENDSPQEMQITNATISGNNSPDGGGIYNQGFLGLLNVVISGNSASTGPDMDNEVANVGITGSLTAQAVLIGNSTNSGIPSSGNILNGMANLSALGDYGGPTQTFALLSASQALGGAVSLGSLVSTIGAGDMTFDVMNGSLLSADTLPILASGYYFVLQIDGEQMTINGVTQNAGTTTLDVLQRGVNGTTAAIHNGGAAYSLVGDQRGAIHRPTSSPDIGAVQTVPPIVLTNPTTQTVSAGGVAVFTASADGFPVPTVRWQISTDGGAHWTNLSDGGVFSGTKTSTLTISGADTSLNGDLFQADFTSADLSANSAGAALIVLSNYTYNAYIYTYYEYAYALGEAASAGGAIAAAAASNAATAFNYAYYAYYYNAIGNQAAAASNAYYAYYYSYVSAYESSVVYAATGDANAYYAWYYGSASSNDSYNASLGL